MKIMASNLNQLQPASATTRESSLFELMATNIWLTGLPTFKGERGEDIIEFLRRFDEQTIGFDDGVKVLGLRRALRDAAREWLNEDCRTELVAGELDKIRKKLIERYSPESSVLRDRQKLMKMSFDPSGRETLASFIDKYIALAKRVGISNEQEIVNGIILAVPTDTQGDLETLESIQTITSLDKIKSLARRYDSIAAKRIKEPIESARLGALVNLASREELKMALDTLREEFRRHHDETLAAIGRDRPRKETSRVCYNCRKPGHLARSCQEAERKTEVKQPSEKNTNEPRKVDYSKANSEAKQAYEAKYGKPEFNCPICQGYHFVYHCPLKHLNEQ